MVVDIYWVKVCPQSEPLYGATAVPKYEHVLAPQPVVAAGGGAGAQCAYVAHAEHPEGALAHVGSDGTNAQWAYGVQAWQAAGIDEHEPASAPQMVHPA